MSKYYKDPNRGQGTAVAIGTCIGCILAALLRLGFLALSVVVIVLVLHAMGVWL